MPLDPVTALAFSCDYYFGKLARRLDPSSLLRVFERAGPGVQPGVIRRAAGLDQLQLQALEESSIEATPMALAQAYRSTPQQQETWWSTAAP